MRLSGDAGCRTLGARVAANELTIERRRALGIAVGIGMIVGALVRRGALTLGLARPRRIRLSEALMEELP